MVETNVVLIDDNHLSREGLLHILRDRSFNVVASVSNVGKLTAAYDGGTPISLIIVDCDTDAANAYQDLLHLRERYPNAKIAGLAGTDDPALLSTCFSTPVDGLVCKDVSSDAFVKTLDLILAGERVFPAKFISMLLKGAETSRPNLSLRQAGGASLSERETQILQCLIIGESNKAIANRLNVTEATIKVHLKSILRKIQVRNRTQAAIWALNNGMQPGEPEARARQPVRADEQRVS